MLRHQRYLYDDIACWFSTTGNKHQSEHTNNQKGGKMTQAMHMCTLHVMAKTPARIKSLYPPRQYTNLYTAISSDPADLTAAPTPGILRYGSGAATNWFYP